MAERRAPKVTVNEGAAPPPPTPSEALIQHATKAEVIEDGRGRKLSVRKPGVLAQFKLVEAVGGDAASNQPLMSMYMPLIYLGALDGDPVIPPANKREIDALILRLDDDGLAALMAWYVEHVVGPTMKAMDDAERRASLKN